MSDTFDPYYEWLGIPKWRQPANAYRLLGISDFEQDGKVIANAADRTMKHLRTYQAGKRSQISQKLLNEVANAKITLLDKKSKAQYDAELGQHIASIEAPDPPAVEPEKVQGLPPTFPDTLPDFDAESQTVRRTACRKRKGTKPPAGCEIAQSARDGLERDGANQNEKQPSEENSIRSAVKIRLAVGAGVVFVFIIAFFVMANETLYGKLETNWYPNGQKRSEGYYKNGNKDGLWTQWDKNGQKSQEGHYKNGKQDGLWNHWDKTGKKSSERCYEDGTPNGLWTVWYPNGKKSIERHYEYGNKDGLWTQWDKNGNKTLETHYKNGKEVGRKEF